MITYIHAIHQDDDNVYLQMPVLVGTGLYVPGMYVVCVFFLIVPLGYKFHKVSGIVGNLYFGTTESMIIGKVTLIVP